MNKSKLIALCAMSTSFAIIFLTIGAYLPDLDLSCIFFAGLCMMLPLSKKSIVGGFLSYIATTLLSLIVTGVRLQVIIPFAIFFGLHPIVNYIFKIKSFNKILGFIIKLIWFIGALFVIYYFTEMFIGLNENVVKFINYIIVFGGMAFFVIYDLSVTKFQQVVDMTIERLKL